MNILSIIPARAKSKGLPMKNIQQLGGKPLIEYSILSAKKSRFINKILVSTNSLKIAQISKLAGAEVPFLRDKKISQSSTPMLNVIKHSLRFLRLEQNYVPDIVLILQPTSPLRTARTIDRGIRLLKRSKATSVLSVAEVKTHPYASFWYHSKYLKPFKPNFKKFYQRQKYPKLYYPTGSVYIFWNETLKKYNSIYGPKIKPLIVDDEISIDIDNDYDLFICEMTMQHWKKYRRKFH